MRSFRNGSKARSTFIDLAEIQMPTSLQSTKDPRCRKCGHLHSEHKVATAKGLGCIAYDRYRHLQGVFYCKCNCYEPAERAAKEN